MSVRIIFYFMSEKYQLLGKKSKDFGIFFQAQVFEMYLPLVPARLPTNASWHCTIIYSS